MLNAGLRTHAPMIDNGTFTIVAEDGNPLPYAKDQAAVMLAAGKTHDALWTPTAAGAYSLYDRTLSLNAPGQGSAGMLAKLRVVGVGVDTTTVYANDDSYSTTQGGTLDIAAAGVLRTMSGCSTGCAAPPSHTASPFARTAMSFLPPPSRASMSRFIHLYGERQRQQPRHGRYRRTAGAAGADGHRAEHRRERDRERSPHARRHGSER
jgi:FtsP/CotA-like multicopper oxidase with cupredoxin domain